MLIYQNFSIIFTVRYDHHSGIGRLVHYRILIVCSLSIVAAELSLRICASTHVDLLIIPFTISLTLAFTLTLLSLLLIRLPRFLLFFGSCLLFLLPFNVVSRNTNNAGGNPEVPPLGVGES